MGDHGVVLLSELGIYNGGHYDPHIHGESPSLQHQGCEFPHACMNILILIETQYDIKCLGCKSEEV